MDILQDYHGLSQASIIEMLLREEARKQGITIPKVTERTLEESLEARERADALRAQRKASRDTSRTTRREEGEEDDQEEEDDDDQDRGCLFRGV